MDVETGLNWDEASYQLSGANMNAEQLLPYVAVSEWPKTRSILHDEPSCALLRHYPISLAKVPEGTSCSICCYRLRSTRLGTGERGRIARGGNGGGGSERLGL